MGANGKSDQEIRLNFKLAEAVNPLLACDLRQFPKGRTRHLRLVTLASIGLVFEKKMLRGGSPHEPDDGLRAAAPKGNGGGYRAKLSDDDLNEIG